MSTMLEEAFDVPNEEGTPARELLPAGVYKAEIVSATSGRTKNGRGHAVNLTWTITEGEYEKRCTWQSILLQHDSADAQRFGRQKFKDVCAACGIAESVTDLNVLLYKPCLIHVIIRTDKNHEFADKNEVTRVKSLVPSWNGSKPAEPKEPASKTMDDEIPW
jgi:Protein of unknown function (DUF669)